MYRHVFTRLDAGTEKSGVRLAFYLATPVFNALKGKPPALTVRIRRKCAPGFRWDHHGPEYFNALDPGRARLIFKGKLPAINNRKFEFFDDRARTGRTYAYWVSSPDGRLPTGPAPVRARDRRVWWLHEEVEARLAALAAGYPGIVETRRFGETVAGRPLTGLLAGSRRRCLALVGAVHAGEAGAELLVPVVERLLAGNRALLAECGLALLPVVNADERERMTLGCPWYLRTNARGVDLNRNFDADWEEVAYGYGLVSSDPDSATYRGPRPESEPETRAVAAFLDAAAPAAILSYHHLASLAGARFLAPRPASGDRAYLAACEKLVAPFIEAFYPGEKGGAGIGFGTTSGSVPLRAYRAGVPGFDLEWDGNPDARDSLLDRTTPALLEIYRERHYRGLVAMLRACAAGGR